MKPCPSSRAEQVRHRHADAVEEQLGGVLTVLADLLQHPPAREALDQLGLDDQQRDARRGILGVGLGDDDDQVGQVSRWR